MSNHVIDIGGDEATCLADPYGVWAAAAGDQLRSSSLGGRYDLKLRRVDGEWLISERSWLGRAGVIVTTIAAVLARSG